MEITSFILGVCAVIVLLMIVGTSVNLLSFRTLKRDLTSLERNLDTIHHSIYRELENIREDAERKEKSLYDYGSDIEKNLSNELDRLQKYIDSRTDKMSDKTKQDLLALQQEIGRVERGYKEKINY